MAVSHSDLRRQLTGINVSLLGFGVGLNWTAQESQREIIRRFLVYLEDRRALYNPRQLETPDWVVESVVEIRKELTGVLQALDADFALGSVLRAMRAGCRKFMDEVGELEGMAGRGYWRRDEVFFTALGELRAIFGQGIAHLCIACELDVEGRLVEILPVPDEADDV